MTYASDYTPTNSFADDESTEASGRSTVRTVELDNQFADIAAAHNELNANVKKLQRDDDKLRDWLVEPRTLSEQTRAMLAAAGKVIRGEWAINTDYAVGDLVQRNAVAYLCQTAHNSGPTFNLGFWIAISGDGQAQSFAEEAEASKLGAEAAATTAAASAMTAQASATDALASKLAAASSQLAAQNSADSVAALSPVNLSGYMLGFLGNTGATGARTSLGVSATADVALKADVANTEDAAKGDALIGTRQPVVGARPRSQHEKNADSITLMDMSGVDPTGATSSSAALAALIAAMRLKSNAVGAIDGNQKTVVLSLPPGMIRLTETVLVPPNVEFVGNGTTILCPDDRPAFESGYYNAGVLTSNWALSDADVVLYGLTGTRFRNITFSGGALPLKLRCAIWAAGVFDCSFYGCQVAMQLRQCFYFAVRNIKIRGDHATLPKDYAIKLERASNAVSFDNYAISNRDKFIRLGEAGLAQASANIVFTNGRLEVGLVAGIEVVGTVYNLTFHDTYAESVETVIFDTDGALKYNVDIQRMYSNSTTFAVDLSGLRDSYIGAIRDFSALPLVKGVVRLRAGTNGNQAIVDYSNIGDQLPTLATRYQLSAGVETRGYFSKYTSGAQSVLRSRDEVIADGGFVQVPVHDRGGYGVTTNYVIGTTTGAMSPTTGTELQAVTEFRWSDYNAFTFGVKVTPNTGSGAGGSTPAPIILAGYVIGGYGHCLTPGFTAAAANNSGTVKFGFGGFGTSGTDPNFAWMRNGQFTAEGIIKLIA